MTIASNILSGIAAIEKDLASSGTSVSDLAGAASTAISNVKTAAVSGVETVVIDVAEAAFPQLKAVVAFVELLKQLCPNLAGADWNSPVRLAQDDGPYADSERAAAAKGGQ